MLKLAVVVGKFQTPRLTEAHKELILEASKYDKVLFVIGSNPIMNEIDFLTFDWRREMIEKVIPATCKGKFEFVPLTDVFNVSIWSEMLDSKINAYLQNLGEFNIEVSLLGGRDCFINYYSGEFKNNFKLLEATCGEGVSATELRQSVIQRGYYDNEDFRNGMLVQANLAYATSFATVDIAILDGFGNILLVKRKTQNKFRFPGGFADPDSISYEEDAARELFEEMTIAKHPSDMYYVASNRIDDKRYAKSKHKIKTIIFKTYVDRDSCEYALADDLKGGTAKWFKCSELQKDDIMPEHHILINLLRNAGAI